MDKLTFEMVLLMIGDSMLAIGLWCFLVYKTKLQKRQIAGLVAAVFMLPFCVLFAWALYPLVGFKSLFLILVPAILYFLGPYYLSNIKAYQELLKQADKKGRQVRKKFFKKGSR